MIATHIEALKASNKTLVLIGALATAAAGVMTLGVGMDTPWAPWERQSETMFPPVLFTLASFVAAVAFCVTTVIFHTFLNGERIKNRRLALRDLVPPPPRAFIRQGALHLAQGLDLVEGRVQ